MKKRYKNKYIEIFFGYYHPCFKICPEFYFDGHAKIIFAFLFFEVFINLPFGSGRNDESEWRSYGFYFYGESRKLFDSFWLCLGEKSKCFYMPWSWDWIRTSNLRIDGTWETEGPGNHKSFYEDRWREVILYESYPYTYILKNGMVQNRIATIKTEEREWRWRWFMWLKYPRQISRNIAIDFNDEVGEETGSWKGGTTGCVYSLKKAETPLECLRRMEKERKF